MKEFITKSFKRELLVSFLGVALLPLIISSLFLIQMFKMKLDRDYQKQDMAQVQQIDEKLTTLFENFRSVTEKLAADEQIRTTLAGKGGAPRSEVYARLYQETVGLRERAEVELYTPDGICQYSTGTELFHTRLLPYWGILKVSAAHPDELIIRREQKYTGEADVLLRASRAIWDEADNPIGFVVISMTAKNFEEILRGDYGTQDGVCILNNFFETVYAAGAAGREDIGTVLRGRLLAGERLDGSYQGNRVYISRLGETGLVSVLLRPELFTADTIRSMYSVLLVMAGASLLLCIAVSERMSNHLSWPIRRLNLAMHRLQQGELDTRLTFQRTDEFGQLSDNFNTMAQELKGYMEQQVSQQKKLNDVQIAMMQAQLNPHFLYNTLDTIKWIAKANHISELATLAAKLAKILRTSISKAAFIPLSDEMELVESYTEIQRIRFNGRFTFSYDLPQQYAACMVPKLIVQPVVENAVIHGLAECEEGIICVRVSGDGARLRIEVQDNGCGIDPERMELLNRREWDKISGHIGMYNVDTIIRLHYGEDYGIRVEQPAEGGTRVVIELPAGKEVSERV
ncbi:MAG: sensor histidine kinase [Lachnospiraceae bacterium]|nr:sensor histidine kinase [Lachnospiraceae bacterium]